MPPDPDDVVGAERAEGEQHHDLQHDARDDEVVARRQQRGVVPARGGRDAAADGLDDEAREVGGEEDARVPGGRQAG